MDTTLSIAGRSVRFVATGAGRYTVTIAGQTARQTITVDGRLSPDGSIIVSHRDLWNVDLWADGNGMVHRGKPARRVS